MHWGVVVGMDTHITQLPKDVLRMIAQKMVGTGTAVGRWGVYATFRLVCKRFYECCTVTELRKHFDQDIFRLPQVCSAKGCRWYIESQHVHYFSLIPENVLNQRLVGVFGSGMLCDRCTHLASGEFLTCITSSAMQYSTSILKESTMLRREMLQMILRHLILFRLYGSDTWFQFSGGYIESQFVWLQFSVSYRTYMRYLMDEHPNDDFYEIMQGAREEHQISYLWECGPDTRRLIVGPCPRTDPDAFYAKCTLGVGVFINMTPVDGTTLTYNEDITKDMAYMRHYNKEHERVEEMKALPLQYRDAALPTDPLHEMSETKQIEWYVSRARKVAVYLKDNPTLVPYFHYRSGAQEEALLVFLVWYMLDKPSCPWENLTQWLIDKDYLQVLRDDEDVLFFGKLVKATDASEKNNALTNWFKKTKK